MLTADQILAEPYVAVKPETSVGKAIEKMVAEKASAVLVLSEDFELIGTLAESVLLRATIDAHLRQDPVSLHMNRRFSTVSQHAPLDVVLDQFVLHGLRNLPVIGLDGYVLGIISRDDLLRAVFGDSARLDARAMS